MSVVKELLRGETNGSISFGDYTLEKKTKREDFEFGGDLYKVKTFREITKLERNGAFVYESVPGTAVHQFAAREDGLSFRVESYRDCEITVELAESTQYLITYDGEQHGLLETNPPGNLSIGGELAVAHNVDGRITKW
ncbi:MAG: endosialidase [Lachnospiraceae bacterium]|nr:endosialidase [Lachnospiraceae bacterium]